MKRFLILAWMGLAGFTMATEMGVSPMWPYFREIQHGAWTMNYEGVMAQARLDGSPVFVLFAGTAWCPHCMEMERNIFLKDSWRAKVQNAYLVSLDFPRRDEGVDTLLSTPAYRTAAGITAEQGRAITQRNWQLHAQYTVPGGTRVGFPTVVVLKSDGTVLGRFSNHDKTATYDALPIVLSMVDELLALGGGEADNYYPGSVFLPEPERAGVAVTNGTCSFGVSDTDDWYRFTPTATNSAAWTFTLAHSDATNGTVTLSLYKNPVLPAIKTVTGALSAQPGLVCAPAAFGSDYYLRVSAGGLTNLLNCFLIYQTALTNDMTALVETSPEAVSVPRTNSTVSVNVRLRRFGATGVPLARVRATEISASDARAGVHFGAVTNLFQLPEGQSDGVVEMSIPIFNPSPDVWRGDKKFRLVVEPISNCTAAAVMTVVTISETVARNAGVLAFTGYGPLTNVFAVPAAPAFTVQEGSKPVVWVTRSLGTDGAVTAKVSYPLGGQTVNKLVTWNTGESGAKSVTLFMPSPSQPPKNQTVAVTLAGDGAAQVSPAAAGKIAITVIPLGTPVFSGSTKAFTVTTYVTGTLTLPVSSEIEGTISARLSSGSLPSGMRLGMTDGAVRISGIPRSTGVYTFDVSLSVMSGQKSYTGETQTFTITVLSLSNVNANPQGTYDGVLIADGVLRGTLAFTARKSGTMTVTVKSDVGQYVFYVKSWAAADAANGQLVMRAERSGVKIDLALLDTGRFGGTVVLADGTESELTGIKRAAFSSAGLAGSAGYYTVVLPAAGVIPGDPTVANAPLGSGYLTLTINNRMTAKFSGKLGDGSSFSGSAPCLPGDFYSTAAFDVYVPVVLPLYSRRGSVTALLGLSFGAEGAWPGDNTVTVLGSSWTYPGRTRKAVADRFTGNFAGGYGAYYGKIKTLADCYAGKTVELAQPLSLHDPEGVQVIVNGASLGVLKDNPEGVTFSAAPATGLFKGRFLARPDTGTDKETRVPYSGILVPAFARGEGFFLFADEAWRRGYSLKRSYLVEIK